MAGAKVDASFAEKAFNKRTNDHFEDVGWMSDRTWVAHCIYPHDAEIARLGTARGSCQFGLLLGPRKQSR